MRFSITQEQAYQKILEELLKCEDEVHIEQINIFLVRHTTRMRGKNIYHQTARAKYYHFLIERLVQAGIIKLKDPQIFGRFILNKEKIEDYLKWKKANEK
jgi:hypothetical protein